MKKLLTLALILSSTTAFATRSRVTALGNSPHLTDTATTYTKPADMMKLSDSLTIESGRTDLTLGTHTTSQGAEGLLIRSMGDSKFALSLGHDDQMIYDLRTAANTAPNAVATVGQQNPIGLSYGMKSGEMSFAGTLIYSNFENKLVGSEQKENSMGLIFGASAAMWNASAAILLADKWQSGTGATLNDYKGKGFDLNAGYDVMSDLYVYGGIKSVGFKSTIATADAKDVEKMTIHIGVVSTIKKDGTEFFYGARLNNETSKDKVTATDSKSSKMNMPLIIGLESEANSWLTLRGSVTQTLLLVDTSKTEVGTTTTVDTSPGANTTTLAAGAGLKFNKVSVDGSILTNQTQTINSGNLLAQVGLTYAF